LNAEPDNGFIQTILFYYYQLRGRVALRLRLLLSLAPRGLPGRRRPVTEISNTLLETVVQTKQRLSDCKGEFGLFG
jgi:hypothetical protein